MYNGIVGAHLVWAWQDVPPGLAVGTDWFVAVDTRGELSYSTSCALLLDSARSTSAGAYAAVAKRTLVGPRVVSSRQVSGILAGDGAKMGKSTLPRTFDGILHVGKDPDFRDSDGDTAAGPP
ncbi:hypothetical protein SCAR479_02336 [Seiridium cardinale]|uniref:Uncharacterized protein n=1 Tax=Seiridium cardinale TaxID=138064 RepID=A0ABR2X5N7_9PEZI